MVRPRAKVTIGSLLEVVYEESIDNKMNDLDLCLEVVSRSCQQLRYIRRWISRKPLEIKAWFQRTTNRKWHMGHQMVVWTMTSRDPKGAVRQYGRLSWRQLGILSYFIHLLTYCTENNNDIALTSTVVGHRSKFTDHIRATGRVTGSAVCLVHVCCCTEIMGVDLHRKVGGGAGGDHGQNINRMPIWGIRAVVTKTHIKQIPWSVSI